MQKIYIVEDDKNIAEIEQFALKNAGYSVEIFKNAKDFEEKIKAEYPDLVILDVMLPDRDGLSILRDLRTGAGTAKIPIIMVTAKGEDMDKIMGLEYGADDYIVKPFNILELKARIKAILRRSVKKVDINEDKKQNVLEVRGLKVDFDSRRVFINGKEANLTAKEFDMLVLFMENPGKVYSRETLLDTIWGYDYPGDARTVDVHVRRLREKIEEKPSEPKYIYTKWGVGYYFG